MVRYTYNTPPPAKVLYNPHLLKCRHPLTASEIAWVRYALKQRRKDIYAQLISVYFNRLLAPTLIFPVLCLGLFSGSIVIIIISLLATLLFLAAYLHFGLRINREAVRTAQKHLNTDSNQQGSPVTATAILSLTTNEAVHCTMTSLNKEKGGEVPLQIPGHWAHLIGTCRFAQLPMRVAMVQAQGTTAKFESMIKFSAKHGGGITHYPTTWTHLSDAEYVLLSIGDLSVDAEGKAGLPPPNTSAPQTLITIFLSLTGLLLASLSVPFDELLPLPGSGTWWSPWLLTGLLMTAIMPYRVIIRIRRYKAVQRFYQAQHISFP